MTELALLFLFPLKATLPDWTKITKIKTKYNDFVAFLKKFRLF